MVSIENLTEVSMPDGVNPLSMKEAGKPYSLLE